MKNWWKIAAALLVIYSFIAGFLVPVPAMNVLNETIRNVFYHVPMWFTMIALLTYSVIHAVIHLKSSSAESDIRSSQVALASVPFALVGLITGSFWARCTWQTWWTTDPKLNGVAVSLLIYLAYFVLRSSIEDEQKRARISAIYNIFAYVLMIVFILIIPKFQASLHPGNGGNVAFGKYDMDNTMRMVFYPAVAGWVLTGCWIAGIRIKSERLRRKILYGE
jgi:heme exporter protein C